MKFRTNKRNVIKNGTTTIVTGEGDMAEIYTATLKLMTELSELSVELRPETKGVAKLSPGDTYDEGLGIKIATRKAEIKARKKAIRVCNKSLELVQQFRNTIAKELDANINRVITVSRELDEVNENEQCAKA